MFTTVIALNLLISLLCLFVAWRVWRLRQTLSRVADALVRAERQSYAVLNRAVIIRAQRGTSALGQRYRGFQAQVRQVQQILTIVSLIMGVMQRGGSRVETRGAKQWR